MRKSDSTCNLLSVSGDKAMFVDLHCLLYCNNSEYLCWAFSDNKKGMGHMVSLKLRCCTFLSWCNSHTKRVTFAGRVLPYVGMCHSEGYGFQEVQSGIGYRNYKVWVENRLQFSRKFINWLRMSV